jgi:hypothetical protein
MEVAAVHANSAMKDLANEVAHGLITKRPHYAVLLGDRLFDFELVGENLRDPCRCLADRARFDALRDRPMDDNARKIAARIPRGAVYGWLEFVLVAQGHEHLVSLSGFEAAGLDQRTI